MTLTQQVPIVATRAALDDYYRSGTTRSVQWRRRQLEAIIRLVEDNESEIASALQDDLGREAVETWLGEIASTVGEAKHALKRVQLWMQPRPVAVPLTQQPALAWVKPEPLGTVLVIGPWNYPVYLTLGPLVAAVAAGNCAVLKPSEHAAATSRLLARLVPEYLDPAAVVVIEGDATTTQQLIAESFDHIVFTGGTAVGSKIMAAAAPTLTPVTLELGGKSPVIVTADADLRLTAQRILWVKWLNAGQTCIAPDYVLIDRTVQDEFVKILTEVTHAFRAEGEWPLRVVNRAQLDRLTSYLSSTKGTIALGGAVDVGHLTLEPTIVVDPDPDEALMREEIFGPILPVIGVDNHDEAITFVNSRPKPLAAYIFTKSRRIAKRVIAEVPSGGTVVNHVAMHCLVPSLPFGGVGASGMGAYHGRTGFRTLSHEKPVLRKFQLPDPSFMYPPYTDKTIKLFRRLF